MTRYVSTTLSRRADILEKEAEVSDSDDGLDMIKDRGEEKEISFDDYLPADYLPAIDLDASDMIELSSDSGASDGRKRKRSSPGGERVAFDSDEDSDAAYTSFKKRKSEQRKKSLASTKRAKAKASKNSVVGRKPKSVIALNDNRRKYDAGKVSDDENDLMDTALPDYLLKRKSDWETKRQKLGDSGLQLPPDFDDIFFSGDERLETLKERPNLKPEFRQREYEDIELPKSLGIIPASIAQWLRPYQVEGAEFLHKLFVYQEGGILGDDMGLGKTIQVIAFLNAAFGKTGDERDAKRMRKMRRAGEDKWYPRVLIICPGTLLANWRSELATWGWWNVQVCHGSAAARDAALAAASSGRLEIMMTTYDTYRNNRGAINGIRWDCVVADECHKIKERKAQICEAMNEVNALCRIGLTGTAIQNKYEELWTLLNWTNPGRLGPIASWKEYICLPLKLGQSHDATNAQLSKARRTAEALVNNLLPKFFLRRVKSLIADQLPKKSDQVVFCPMTEAAAQAYNNICDSELVQTILHSSDPCSCGSKRKRGWCCDVEVDGQKWQNFVFPGLVTLQKLSNHLALLIPTSEADRDKHEREMMVFKSAVPDMWQDLYKQRDNIVNFANTAFCGKWKILQKLLKFWYGNGDKVLIFSFSVRLLKMLKMLFTQTSYNVSYLDGGMHYQDRQNAVDEFNSDPKQFVFLISTKAGGVGLNITSANKVVVVDPNWNPSYDLQAQDRAYRIGQTRDVEVFRLISVGTLEEVVYARQIYKQQQANIGYNASMERRYFKGVQDQKEMKGEIFGLANLFAPLSENVKLRDIVNKTNVAETRAGVEIAALNLDAPQEGDDDASPLLEDMKADAAMSQLAAEIIDEPAAKRKAAAKGAKKKDAVQAILASAGVDYTHENAEVVGTSRIETKISSRAQRASNNIGMDSDYAFARSQESQGIPARRNTRTPDAVYAQRNEGDEMSDDLDDDTTMIKYKYRPPEDVRKRQFCSMAKRFGYEDVTEFALVVEGWTQKDRRNCLDRFYRDRKAELAKS